ncbi:MAG: TIGR01212 family radical SAM protein, partial [Bacteroidaceae bacterium]|nr:TIGR01212 family radical SAM protein [Bacteroidaceae bacterium]
MHPFPYTKFDAFLQRHFSHKVQKLSIHAGFTCPNRDGTLGRGGCTYCNNQTFNPDYCATGETVAQQLERGKTFFRRAQAKRALGRGKPLSAADQGMKYLAYFQAYTNTYGELEHLKRLYEEALAVDDVVGLVVGTRPDCMSDALLAYLADLHRQAFVLVEYGVESTYDTTLLRINRGHDYATSVAAIEATHQAGIPVGAHFILGLPGETREMTLA